MPVRSTTGWCSSATWRRTRTLARSSSGQDGRTSSRSTRSHGEAEGVGGFPYRRAWILIHVTSSSSHVCSFWTGCFLLGKSRHGGGNSNVSDNSRKEDMCPDSCENISLWCVGSRFFVFLYNDQLVLPIFVNSPCQKSIPSM